MSWHFRGPRRPVLAFSVAVAAAALAACRAASPTPGPEARCADACESRVPACGATRCARGCRFMMDRVVEREGARVLACVAKAKSCDDGTFASCAAVVPYPDGGPPPPKPPQDIDLGDEDDEGPAKKDDKKKDDDDL